MQLLQPKGYQSCSRWRWEARPR